MSEAPPFHKGGRSYWAMAAARGGRRAGGAGILACPSGCQTGMSDLPVIISAVLVGQAFLPALACPLRCQTGMSDTISTLKYYK